MPRGGIEPSTQGFLDAAGSLNDLRIPPSNRLEKLSGDCTGHHSIRVNRTTERFWMNLQSRYDLEVEKDHLGSRLDSEVRERAAG